MRPALAELARAVRWPSPPNSRTSRPTACNCWPNAAFVAPGAPCVSIAQDRIAEKRFFVDCAASSGVLPAPHKMIASHADIDAIGDDLLPGILKTVRMGYDGKGQVARAHARRRARRV